ASPFPAENLCSLCININEGHAFQKRSEALLACVRIARIVDALVYFCECGNRKTKTLVLKVLEALGDGRMSIEVMNGPVGIHEIANAHSFGTGRVEMSRSA